uniref:Multiple epidermal growth factor-like domains 6 n=1 Tax=Magallana gigas TaxID=29159 RepID=A0A8W8L3K4_MAGGI
CTHFSSSVTACPPGTYGTNCFYACPNQHYGENCGRKCNCGPDEKCHIVHGCISITTTLEKQTTKRSVTIVTETIFTTRGNHSQTIPSITGETCPWTLLLLEYRMALPY